MTSAAASTILRNAKFNLFGRLWCLVLGLFLTPYIVNKLGVDLFGVWAIIMVITGFIGLIDCGATTSFIKFIAEFQSTNEYSKINQLINTGIIFYLFLSLLIIILSMMCLDKIFVLFNIPSTHAGDVTQAIYWAIITYCLSTVFSPIYSVQAGFQRMDLTNKVNILLSIPATLGTIFFLERGYGLLGLVYNNMFITILTITFNLFIAYRLFPGLRLCPSQATLAMGKKIWGYGYKLQIAHISSIVSQQIDKIILSHFLSIGMVTFYQLGSSIIDHLRSLVLLLFTPIMPAFAEMEATGNRETFLRGYILGTKYLAMLILPLFAFIILSAPQIMTVWMGSGYRDSAFVIAVLGLGYLFAVLSGLRSMALQATGKTHIEMWAGIMAIILNIPLSLILVLFFGFYGVAIGTSISLFFSAWYGLWAFNRSIGLPVWSFLRETLLDTTVITLLLSLLLLLFTNITESFFHLQGRWEHLLFLLIQATFFGFFYLAFLYFKKPIIYSDVAILLHGKDELAGKIVRRFSTVVNNQ